MNTVEAAGPPWHFRLAKSLIRRGWRGPGLWIRAAHRLGLLNRVARYSLAEGVSIEVPLSRREYWWDAQEVRDYERAVVTAVRTELVAMARPWRLVDCGADIGLFACLLTAAVGRLDEIVALEPNTFAYGYLLRNLARLPGEAVGCLAAVADFRGRGRLVSSPDDASQHASYLLADPEGDVQVVRLDDVMPPGRGTVVVKLDVEGGELPALRGAERLIRDNANVVVVFEAHRDVARRSGVDPLECLRWLQQQRRFAAYVAERRMGLLRPEGEFFQQFPDLRIANIVCRSE